MNDANIIGSDLNDLMMVASDFPAVRSPCTKDCGANQQATMTLTGSAAAMLSVTCGCCGTAGNLNRNFKDIPLCWSFFAPGTFEPNTTNRAGGGAATGAATAGACRPRVKVQLSPWQHEDSALVDWATSNQKTWRRLDGDVLKMELLKVYCCRSECRW